MGLWDKLREGSDYVRKLRLSRGPDSYFRYKRTRESQRKDAEHERAQAKDLAEREREEAGREREYGERYAAERERDIAREGTKRAEEIEPEQ
jgi:hypothetical protein